MNIKVFIKKGCEKCEIFKEKLLPKFKKEYDIKVYSMDNADGLGEAMFYGVTMTPTIIIFDDKGMKKWYKSIKEAEKELLK